MLPTHTTNSRTFNTHPTARVSLKSYIGRPLLRYIPVVLGCVVTLWLFGPVFLGILPPGPPGLFRPPPPRPPPPPTIWTVRAEAVRSAFVHAYSGYEKHAFPADELLPVTGGKIDNFNGWGVTVFDALDTMWIMGLHDTFHEAMILVAKTTFALTKYSYAPFFETVIRYLGGLLSAYALSGETILLSRADDLGRMLLPAFNTTSGFPMFAVNTVTGTTRGGWSGYVLWAEALSNQMEYKYLAHLTGKTDYYHKSEHIMEAMYNANITDGLFSTMWDLHTGTPANQQYSVGAYADSAHEYLLKQWLLTAESEPKARDLYLQSVNGILNNLMYLTPNRSLLYVTDMQHGFVSHTFEHLSCFLPGLLALGAHTLPLVPEDKELHFWAAKGLAYTCWMTYADQESGLGPDEMHMQKWDKESDGRWMVQMNKWEEGGREGGIPPGLAEGEPVSGEGRDYNFVKMSYLLRPETIESFYILWRTTGDERWRERGWSIFESIENYTKTEYGYATISNVNISEPQKLDSMPSYFLAETLKYLFLLFTDEEILPLDKWVFNTEAHPLPVFNWKPWEREEYGIPSPGSSETSNLSIPLTL